MCQIAELREGLASLSREDLPKQRKKDAWLNVQMSWTVTLTILIHAFHPPMNTEDGKQMRKTWEKENSDVFAFVLCKKHTHSELFNIL